MECVFFQAEDGIRDLVRSRGLGDVYKRQLSVHLQASVPYAARAPGIAMLKPNRDVGLVGHGAYVPRYRLAGEEIARVWRGKDAGWPVKQKAVAGIDAVSYTHLTLPTSDLV